MLPALNNLLNDQRLPIECRFDLASHVVDANDNLIHPTNIVLKNNFFFSIFKIRDKISAG